MAENIRELLQEASRNNLVTESIEDNRERYISEWTGKDQQKDVLKIHERETVDQKVQRARLFNSPTVSLLNTVSTRIDRLFESDNIHFEYKNQKGEDAEKVKGIVNDFYDGYSLLEWYRDIFKEHLFVDPEAYWIIEQDNKGTIYPLIIDSDRIREVKKEKGGEKYIIWSQEVEVEIQGRKVRRKEFWYHSKQKIAKLIINEKEETYKEWPYNLTVNPFGKLGVFFDNSIKQHVPIWWKVRHVLDDLKSLKSEWNIYWATHGILKTFAYVPACTHYDPEDRKNVCIGGTMSITKKECENCKGEGHLPLHTSSQDIIVVRYRDNQRFEELIPIDKLVHQIKHDPTYIDKLDSTIKTLEKKIYESIFNNNPFGLDTSIGKTHDEILDSREGERALLLKIGRVYSKSIRQIVRLIGSYLNESIICVHQFPKDLQLETTRELANLLKIAEESGAPQAFKQRIREKIMRKAYPSDHELSMTNAIEKFRPWAGMSVNEVNIIKTILPRENPEAVLHSFFHLVEREIRSRPLEDLFNTKEKYFYNLNYEDQKAIIYTLVNQIILDQGIKELERTNPFNEEE